MPIGEDQIKRMARLARLELSPTEQVQFTRELPQIIAYFDRIARLETDKIKSLSPKAATPMREDIVRPSLPADDAVKNAPEKKDNFLIVPRVI